MQHTTDSFVVECDLGLQHFDSPRTGQALARAAYEEVQRLGRTDDRVRATRWSRCDRLTVRVTVTVQACDARTAYQVASGLVRTGIHTIGGSTAGWEAIRPQLCSPAARHPLPRRERGDHPAPPGWAQWSAAARHRLDSLPTLPPLSSVVPGGMIDLRRDLGGAQATG